MDSPLRSKVVQAKKTKNSGAGTLNASLKMDCDLAERISLVSKEFLTTGHQITMEPELSIVTCCDITQCHKGQAQEDPSTHSHWSPEDSTWEDPAGGSSCVTSGPNAMGAHAAQ